jgi:hypothetical protein
MQRPARDNGRLFPRPEPMSVLVATDPPLVTGGIHDVFMAYGNGRLWPVRLRGVKSA